VPESEQELAGDAAIVIADLELGLFLRDPRR
jgi:hypothetical protein